MKISVIVPTYRPQSYLWECLDSLVAQTYYKDLYEVIIILNGCNDPYYSRIEEYIRRNHECRLRMYQTDVPGVSNARNIGIENALGEYFVFIDDDDIVSPSYLEDLLKVSSPTCVGCATSYAFINDVSERLPNFMNKAYEACKGRKFSLYSYRQFLSPPVIKLIHRDIVGTARFPINLRKSEDSVFCLELSPRIKNMKLASPDAIYYQRLRQGSAMHTKTTKWNEVRCHLKIEWEYIKVWFSNPFQINVLFALSRMAACMKNLRQYLNEAA